MRSSVFADPSGRFHVEPFNNRWSPANYLQTEVPNVLSGPRDTGASSYRDERESDCPENASGGTRHRKTEDRVGMRYKVGAEYVTRKRSMEEGSRSEISRDGSRRGVFRLTFPTNRPDGTGLETEHQPNQ